MKPTMVTPSWAWAEPMVNSYPNPNTPIIYVEKSSSSGGDGGGCNWIRWLVLGFVFGILWFFLRPFGNYRTTNLTTDYENYTRSIG